MPWQSEYMYIYFDFPIKAHTHKLLGTGYMIYSLCSFHDVEVWEDDSCDDDIPDVPIVGCTCIEEKDLVGWIIIFFNCKQSITFPIPLWIILIKFFVCFSLLSVVPLLLFQISNVSKISLMSFVNDTVLHKVSKNTLYARNVAQLVTSQRALKKLVQQ